MDVVAEWEAWQARDAELRAKLAGMCVEVEVATIQTPALPCEPCGVCGGPGVHWPVGSPEPTCCECEHAPGECWHGED